MNGKIKFTKGLGLWIFTCKKKKKSKKGNSLASILEERDKQWKARSSFSLHNRRKKERRKKIRQCSLQLTRMQNSMPAKLIRVLFYAAVAVLTKKKKSFFAALRIFSSLIIRKLKLYKNLIKI